MEDYLRLFTGVSDPSHFNRRIRTFRIRIHLKMHSIKNVKAGNLLALLLIIGFRNYRENNQNRAIEHGNKFP